MSDSHDLTIGNGEAARFKHDVPVEVDGAEYRVTVNVLAYAHLHAVLGNSEADFTSVELPLTPAPIPATGEIVFRMDLTRVKEKIRQLAADGAFDGD